MEFHLKVYFIKDLDFRDKFLGLTSVLIFVLKYLN